VPPVAASVCEYATAAVPPGSGEDVLIVGEPAPPPVPPPVTRSNGIAGGGVIAGALAQSAYQEFPEPPTVAQYAFSIHPPQTTLLLIFAMAFADVWFATIARSVS
jgi:hypothetical protein